MLNVSGGAHTPGSHSVGTANFNFRDEVIVYTSLILQTKLQTTEPSLHVHMNTYLVLIVCDQLSEDFLVILPVAILKTQKPVRARPTTLNAIALLQRIKN